MFSESSDFWTTVRTGTFSRRAQAQVWALTRVSELRKLQLMQEEIAAQQLFLLCFGPPSGRNYTGTSGCVHAL